MNGEKKRRKERAPRDRGLSFSRDGDLENSYREHIENNGVSSV